MTSQSRSSAPLHHNRAWLVVLGLLSVTPIVYFPAFMMTAVAGVASSSRGGSASPGLSNWLPAAHLAVIFLWWGLTAIYLVDVYRTPRLVGMNKALWAALVAFGGPVAWPIYWYLNMWREPSSDSALAGAPER